MNIIQVIALAILQGVTELFPISSLGHTVLLPGFLGWGNILHSATFLPLVVTLHIGTSAALLTFFWRDWVNLLLGGWRVLKAGRLTPDVDPGGYGRTLSLIVVGTIPAGLIGLLFQKQLEANFSEPLIASAFLVANGAVLLTAESFWRRQRVQKAQLAMANPIGVNVPIDMRQSNGFRTIQDLSFTQAFIIGFAQSFALIPGISRSGSTMVAGMANGLDHEESARFSFLLATPIIAAAGLLEIPKLLHDKHALLTAGIGGIIAGIAAYLSVKFLMKYFESNTLKPFAYYCVVLGFIGFTYFTLQSFQILP